MTTVTGTNIDPVEYRDIPGFPGYRVGSDGSVWSCRQKRNHEWTWRRLKPRRMKTPRPLTDGKCPLAVLISPSPGHPAKNRFVHHLVLLSFVGPCPDGMECCHRDGSPENNALENLRWDTPQANHADMARHGRRRYGENKANAKLKEEDIHEIRRLRANGLSLPKLAATFGVCCRTVINILAGKKWKHVPVRQ